MKVKSLRGPNHALNKTGRRLSAEADRTIRALVETYAKRGYNLDEVKSVITTSASYLCAMEQLTRQARYLKTRKR